MIRGDSDDDDGGAAAVSDLNGDNDNDERAGAGAHNVKHDGDEDKDVPSDDTVANCQIDSGATLRMSERKAHRELFALSPPAPLPFPPSPHDTTLAGVFRQVSCDVTWRDVT
eukprot:1519128-Rhodomonas_salina.4